MRVSWLKIHVAQGVFFRKVMMSLLCFFVVGSVDLALEGEDGNYLHK